MGAAGAAGAAGNLPLLFQKSRGKLCQAALASSCQASKHASKQASKSKLLFAAIEARATWPNTARSTRHAEHGARVMIIIQLLILAAAAAPETGRKETGSAPRCPGPQRLRGARGPVAAQQGVVRARASLSCYRTQRSQHTVMACATNNENANSSDDGKNNSNGDNNGISHGHQSWSL